MDLRKIGPNSVFSLTR